MDTKFKIGDTVLISPQVTGEQKWIEAIVFKIDDNPFVGIVLNVKTEDGRIFFEKEYLFKPLKDELCMQ